ncbi:IS110 family RNA-guided transposase [Candidatus Hakubella thermalkaliphila]|uniref:Uncharacterized protein n=1 Tax=Candidatus Hakubella thermalkaliphila TaxID=2754717 RepID=A0A6V8P862_9ACTN|nr:IS110 family transposase [Candidatus Hakubella thermalkaliphila]GFP27854.1 hypothetical protein HKBW3S33_01264 [Candidatus Hakubella thermalkaliphila]
MDQEGKVLAKSRVSTDRPAIQNYLKSLDGLKPTKAVIEAGFNWSYFYDQLAEEIEEVCLAHPLKTRLIAEARIKTDSLDSETLAHLLRSDLIARAYAPSWETREVKNLLRFRISLVRIRTSLKNKVHSVLDRHQVEDNVFRGLTDKFGKTGMKIMRSLELRGNDRAILNGYLDLIEELSRRIAALNKQIKALVKEDEISSYLKTVPGFGDLLGLLLRYEIDNMERFASAKKLCSYVGIVPSTYSSGGKTWHGRITKEGNKWRRWVVIEAVHGAIITSPSLRRYYNSVKQRRGDKAATIALARKLLEIIYHVWKEKRPYYEKELAYTV